VVAPMSGHHATLLRGTVETLLPAHDVYITDWIDARMVPLAKGGFDLADYIDYIIDFLRVLGPGTHVMAVCQPSPPVLAAIALMAAANDPATPASMTLMGGPVDTRKSPTAVNVMGMSQDIAWFERKVIDLVPPHYPGAMRRVYPGFLQLGGFMSMNPSRHVASHLEFFDHLVLLPDVVLQNSNPRRVTRTGDAETFIVNYSYAYDGSNRPLTRTGQLTITNGPNVGRQFQTSSAYTYY